MGFPPGMKGYKLYDITKKNFFSSRMSYSLKNYFHSIPSKKMTTPPHMTFWNSFSHHAPYLTILKTNVSPQIILLKIPLPTHQKMSMKLVTMMMIKKPTLKL